MIPAHSLCDSSLKWQCHCCHPNPAVPWWSTGRSLHSSWGGSLTSLLGSSHWHSSLVVAVLFQKDEVLLKPWIHPFIKVFGILYFPTPASCGPQILAMENLLRIPQGIGSSKVDHQVLEKRNCYLYFKVHLHYWQPIFTRLEIKHHKSSQNKSIAMNKKYYGNIQLADGLTNEH